MKTLSPTLTMVVTFITNVQSAPFPWVNTDYLSQPQEQAPDILTCIACEGADCFSAQTEIICGVQVRGGNDSCYTLQAFDIVQNTPIFLKGCIRDSFCIENQACELVNQSLGGSVRFCSLNCCNTFLCNAGAVRTTPPPRTTTRPPTTTTDPPPTTTTSPPTTTKTLPTTTPPPTTTTSPPTTTTSSPTTTPPPTTTTSPPTTTTSPPTTTPPPTTTTSPPPTSTSPPTTTPPPTTTLAPPTTTGPTTTLPTTVATTTPFRPGICGGPLASPSGYLASPYYPLNYPNNAYCVWIIIVPQGFVLRIDFLYFETEKCFDFVKIYVGTRIVRYLTGDDIDDDDDENKHKCDDKDDKDDEKDNFSWYFNTDEGLDGKTVSIHGKGEMIRIVFGSDSSVTKRGFFARYTVVEGTFYG